MPISVVQQSDSVIKISSVQSLSDVWFFATPWIAACQASLSITNLWSSLKLKSIESVMPSSHLILCHPLLLLPPIPPSIRVFSNESTLQYHWLIIKEPNPVTVKWKKCIQHGMGKGHRSSMPYPTVPFSPSLHVFTNLKTIWTSSFGFLWEFHYIHMID